MSKQLVSRGRDKQKYEEWGHEPQRTRLDHLKTHPEALSWMLCGSTAPGTLVNFLRLPPDAGRLKARDPLPPALLSWAHFVSKDVGRRMPGPNLAAHRAAHRLEGLKSIIVGRAEELAR